MNRSMCTFIVVSEDSGMNVPCNMKKVFVSGGKSIFALSNHFLTIRFEHNSFLDVTLSQVLSQFYYLLKVWTLSYYSDNHFSKHPRCPSTQNLSPVVRCLADTFIVILEDTSCPHSLLSDVVLNKRHYMMVLLINNYHVFSDECVNPNVNLNISYGVMFVQIFATEDFGGNSFTHCNTFISDTYSKFSLVKLFFAILLFDACFKTSTLIFQNI